MKVGKKVINCLGLRSVFPSLKDFNVQNSTPAFLLVKLLNRFVCFFGLRKLDISKSFTSTIRKSLQFAGLYKSKFAKNLVDFKLLNQFRNVLDNDICQRVSLVVSLTI